MMGHGITLRNVKTGDELFACYGDSWDSLRDYEISQDCLLPRLTVPAGMRCLSSHLYTRRQDKIQPFKVPFACPINKNDLI